MREQVCQHAVPRFADLGQIVAIARPQGLRHGIVPGWSGNNFQAGLGDEILPDGRRRRLHAARRHPRHAELRCVLQEADPRRPLKNITSRFAMEKIKSITALPIPLVVAD